MASFAQQVIWTALPRPLGEKGKGQPEVSVLVSPRLTVERDDALLRQFPDWLDWPRIVQNAEFVVTFGKQELKASLISKPEGEVWRAIFAPDTVVRPRPIEDLTDKLKMSYPLAVLGAMLREKYIDITHRWPSLPPTASELASELSDFNRAPAGPDALKRLSSPKPEGAEKELGDLAPLAHLRAFLEPLQAEGKSLGGKDARKIIDGMDFHRLVAALGQHSMLLRQTGLVLDLALEGKLKPGEEPLSVEVKWPAGKEVDKRPDGKTALMTRYGKGVFEAVADSKRIKGRRLDLSDPRFEPVQVDVEGGIIKLSGVAASADSRTARIDPKQGKTAADEAPMALPTLRSAGIVLAEAGRGEALSALLQRSSKFEDLLKAKKAVPLFAEDVTRGQLVDVEVDGEWRSLCRLVTTYEFTRAKGELTDKEAEGLIQLATGEAPPGAKPDYAHIMRLTEALFHWDGWSLAAPRPGLALDQEGEPQRDAEAGGLPVAVDSQAAPRSLPALRFGKDYRLRVRLADLAHNAEPWNDKSDKAASKKITYRRFEPVQPPVPALVERAGVLDAPEDGASLLRLVIRSRDGGLDQPTTDDDVRMFFPPRASVEMAERHGELDGADGRPDPNAYQLITARDDDLPSVPSAVEAQRVYPFSDEARSEAPWLPDPASGRTRAVIAPDRPRKTPFAGFKNEAVTELTAGDDWPDQRPWTLRLQEAPSGDLLFVPAQNTDFAIDTRVDWDVNQRLMTVSLPKGETATLTLSSKFDGKGEPADLFGLAAWLKEGLSEEAYQSVRQIINNGEHWAFTPALKIELVHATQRPMVAPAPDFPLIVRSLGDTAADLSLTSPCHAESTASLSLDGRWVEAFDDGETAPGATWRTGHAWRRTLEDTASPTGDIALNGAHEFGDTLYRRIRYRLTGASRFTEFFPPNIRNNPATTRRASDDVVVHIPNTAPPPPPVVTGSTPVFEWLRDSVGSLQASWRRCGVRVFLDRPWFTTGFGEMLAATLPRDAEGKELERVGGHVTLWSNDPIWTPGANGAVAALSPGMDAFPTRARPEDAADPRWPDAFPLEERALTGGAPRFEDLPLPNDEGGVIGNVDAAGHPVSWDEATGRYYADLMLDPGRVYQPFIRLAVARLHPVSADGAHLSPAVMLDMTQVLPERLAIARKDGSSGWRIEVYGALHGEDDDAHETNHPFQNVMRVEVQRTSRNAPDELDWETVDETGVADSPAAWPMPELAPNITPYNFSGSALFPGKTGPLAQAAINFNARRGAPIFVRRIKAPGAGGGPRGSFRWRIRITETERHSADLLYSLKAEQPGANERVVFSETFEI